MGKNGWKRMDEVWIPPIVQDGFQEEVMIRNPIEPICPKRVEEMSNEEREEETIPLFTTQENFEEEATVLLNREVVFTAYVQRKKTGEKVRVDQERFVIGKGSSANYIIRDNATISRQHVEIRRTEDGYYLEDLDSSNHTFVDGIRLVKPVKLVSGTVFQLSDEEFEFLLLQ